MAFRRLRFPKSINRLFKKAFKSVRRKAWLWKLGIIVLLGYLLFFCPLTAVTSDRFISLLSSRRPVGIIPQGAVVDVEQTKDLKYKKLSELKLEAYKAKEDFLGLFGFNHTVSSKAGSTTAVNTGESNPWINLQRDLAAAGSDLVDYWGTTIISYQGQTIIVGENSTPTSSEKVLKWQKEIEAAAAKYRLEPALIAAVMEQESGGDPAANSPKGAIGLMQLMPATAKMLGVNPYDPQQNIDGGAHYLYLQLKTFGSIQSALAAYNAGPGKVEDRTWVNQPETLNYVEHVPALITKYEKFWQDYQMVTKVKS